MPDEREAGQDPFEVDRQRREIAAALNHMDNQGAWWRDLIVGTATVDVGHLKRVGATLLMLAKLLKVISDTDMLLIRSVGLGSLRVVVQFDAQSAAIAAKAAPGERAPLGHPAPDNLRQAVATHTGGEVTTIQPHYLLALLARHCDGEGFTPDEFPAILKQLAGVPTDVLLYRLGLTQERPAALDK